MKFLNVLDLFTQLYLLGEKPSRESSSAFFIWCWVMLLIAILGLAIEIPFIIRIDSMFIFLALVMGAGLLLGCLLTVILFKTALVKSFTPKSFLLILLTATLWTTLVSSFINRKDAKQFVTGRYYTVVEGATNTHSKRIVVQDSTLVRSIQVPDQILSQVKKGDVIKLEKAIGRLGFVFVVNYSLIDKKAYH